VANDPVKSARTILALIAGGLVLSATSRAEAYRPFDGTDADVAETGIFELELGPAHYYRQGSQNFLITPSLVLNFGLFEGTELVIDAQEFVALGKLQQRVPRIALLGDDVLMKHIFREGTLQGKTGVSIAAEGGLLTPEINGDEHFGGSLDVITSYRWSWGTFHWNEWFELTRDDHADLFTGVILEGPHDWAVRPVAELFYDHDFVVDSKSSLLLGAIWTVRDSLALDIGVRGARNGDENAAEVRLGLTWAIPMGRRSGEPPPVVEGRRARTLAALRPPE
jgi:hypothetical protein